jgi:PadR family transcriptional regulator, regulatory protein PadR
MSLPRLSKLEAAMLQLLVNQGELYGLQMLALEPNLRRGSLYVTLNRMEEKGYVESREFKELKMSGLPRRLYKLTGLGRRVLSMSQNFALEGLGDWVHA